MPHELWLYGIAPTQFTDAGELDAGAMASNTERLSERGIDRFLLTGAYGEFQSLTDDERVEIVRAIVRTRRCRSVMAGASHPSTAATARLAQRLFDAGADMVMVAPPMLTELTGADVDRHFDQLASEVGGRLVIYNNPVFGTELTAQDVARLANLGPYEAVKQGTTRIDEVIESLHAVRMTGSDMKVLAASDLSAPATLAVGLDGLTSTNCWAFPEAFIGLVEAASKGDLDRMRQISGALEPYARVVRRFGQPRTVKAAMQLRGFVGSRHVRLPHVGLSHDEASQLADALSASDAFLAEIDYGGPHGG